MVSLHFPSALEEDSQGGWSSSLDHSAEGGLLISSSPGHSWRPPETSLSHYTGPLSLLFLFTQ